MSTTDTGAARRRTALVTGASRGIGAEIARLLAFAGYDLVLVSRGGVPAREDQVGGPSVRHVSKDLSEPGAVEDLWSELSAAGTAVDVLVNNAGTGLYGPLNDHDADVIRAMIELNVTSLTALTRRALPGMLSRGWGRILNVA